MGLKTIARIVGKKRYYNKHYLWDFSQFLLYFILHIFTC